MAGVGAPWLVGARRRCCHSSLSSPTSSESVFIKACWQDLHAPDEDWSCGLMLNLGTGGLSKKLWECPLIYISHTLRSLRTIWEHIKNAYTWFQPPGDAECMNMELGPVTCVFYNLPRWSSEAGGNRHSRVAATPMLHSCPITHPSSWPLCVTSLFWTLTLLYLCLSLGLVLGPDFALLWSTMVNSRALPALSVVLTLSYHSWFTGNFLEHLWDLAFGFILFFIINYSEVMLALCGFCASADGYHLLSFPASHLCLWYQSPLWISSMMENLGPW